MKRTIPILTTALLVMADPALAGSPCPPGFAQLQNSDTCVRISGRVRAETIVGSSGGRSSDKFRSQASGRVQMDMRKQTEYGPLRAVIAVDGIGR